MYKFLFIIEKLFYFSKYFFICYNPNLIKIKFNFHKIIKKNIIIKKNNHYFFLLIILVNFSLILSFN